MGKKRIQGSCPDEYSGPVPMTLNSLVMRAVRPLIVLVLNDTMWGREGSVPTEADNMGQ